MRRMHHVDGGVSSQVVAKLVELRGERTDVEMARLLGCTKSHWNHLQAGRRRVSYALIKRAIGPFPSLYPIVASDLLSAPTEKAS